MSRRSGWMTFFSAYRSAIVIMGAPWMFLPILLGFPENDKQAKCAYVVCIMGSYWVFEALPLAITALIPMVLFPFFEIMKSDQVAKNYLPDTSFLFIGGLMVAVAVEKSQLHTRIALFVLKTVGSQPKWIMAGFMGVTGFLSMWISNTATAALMVPIVQSVIMELVSNHRMHEMMVLTEKTSRENRRRSIECRRLSISNQHQITPSGKDFANFFTPRELSMAKGLLISVCFSANIGGAATITGTASNLVLIGQLEKLFPRADTGINFLSWIMFAFPLAFVCLICCWAVLWFVFLRNSPKGSAIVSQKLKDKYEQLPPISFAEVAVMALFLVLLALWVLREPEFVAGFGDFFRKGYVTDATSAVFICILLFIIPDQIPMCFAKKKRITSLLTTDEPEPIVRSSLLEWDYIQERFPWSVVLLLGGGFALASGVKESHLSHEIGEVMRKLDVFPVFIVMGIVVMITLCLTNICSNTVIASIFIPIVAELARSLDTNPLYYMLPVALSSSFAFMLPVATPPNAIVFGAGIVQVKDMMCSGILLTVCCFGLTILNMVLWGKHLFNLDEFPIWAYDIDHPIDNITLIQQFIRDNLTVYPELPFPGKM